jgi:predicted NACHT family NTPase
MIDRQVRQVAPLRADQGTEQRRTFSEFINQPNIVLLGDPGAGKTYLFRSSAAATGGEFLTVRNFLNGPPSSGQETLFIDALDEKRAGRGDDDVIDRMVQKLLAHPPDKVRIACRASDWLGASDLAAFQLYFDQHGGVVVLSLQALSSDEQKAILQTQGIDDPLSFLNEATERGVEDFLVNPQNLIMLADVVSSGEWPKTRTKLFDTSTRLLLSEHNPEHARRDEGIYGPDELRAVAGAVCALRLISDVEGVSLSDQDTNPDYPSYRTTGLSDAGKVRAALGRRLFADGHR